MDETQPIPLKPQRGESRPDFDAQESFEETRPIPVEDWKSGSLEGWTEAARKPVEHPAADPVSRAENAEPAGKEQGDQNSAPPWISFQRARLDASFTPPPPPNWPDREGWKIGRSEERKGGAGEASISTPQPALLEPAITETRPIATGTLSKPRFPEESPTPSLAWPAAPVDAQPEMSTQGQAEAPAEAATAVPVEDLEPGRAAGGRAGRSAMRRTGAPFPRPQTRLQRALTLFVLVATVLMALGTVAVAVYIYQPDLDFLAFFRPGETNGEGVSSPSVDVQGTPLGEILAERVPLGTPGAIAVPPTPHCEGPSLTLGETRFRIKMVQAAADGLLQVPSAEPSVAYWVEGTDTHFVFALSPIQENLALLSSLENGDPAVVELASCNTNEFSLENFAETVPASEELLDQSLAGISIVLQGGPGEQEFIASGGMAGQQFVLIEPPAFDPNEVEAEIGLLEKTVSMDGSKVTVRVSVYNYSPNEFSVTEKDVAIVHPGENPLPPSESRPRLPRRVRPGTTEEFEFTFPNTGDDQGIFQIFTAEFDLEDF